MITTDEKGRFLKWLTKAASYSAVPEIYASLSELDFYCRKRGILKKPLFETHDAVTLGRVRTVIGFDSDFRDAYRNKSKDILSAMQYYAYYVRSEGLEEPIPEDEDKAEKDELETDEAVEVPEEAVEEEEEEEAAEQTVEETADVPEEETEDIVEEATVEVPEEEAEETPVEVLEEEAEEMPVEAPQAEAAEEAPVEAPQAEAAEEAPVEVPQAEAAEETPVEEAEEEENYMPYKKPRAKRYRMEGQYYDWLSRLDRGGKQRGDR